MATPTQQIIQRGSFANDGTGDTLRDAAQKINDNFTYLWNDFYYDVSSAPGREFVCGSISTSAPDSGEFTLSNSDLEDSGQYFRIHQYDQSRRSYKTSTNSPGITGLDLSIWSLDSGTTDEWSLLARFEGNVQYTNKTWVFQQTNTIIATTDGIESGGTYYLKLDGAW